jgi:DNA-binding NarL/FixJ family response regulator
MTILCVDNTPIMLQSLQENATRAFPRANVQTFLGADAAWECAENRGCDVLLCEINPPRLDGIFLAEKIKNLNPRVNIIFVTVCSENEYAREVMRLRPSGYLTKEATNIQLLYELQNLRYPVSSAS